MGHENGGRVDSRRKYDHRCLVGRGDVDNDGAVYRVGRWVRPEKTTEEGGCRCCWTSNVVLMLITQTSAVEWRRSADMERWAAEEVYCWHVDFGVQDTQATSG